MKHLQANNQADRAGVQNPWPMTHYRAVDEMGKRVCMKLHLHKQWANAGKAPFMQVEGACTCAWSPIRTEELCAQAPSAHVRGALCPSSSACCSHEWKFACKHKHPPLTRKAPPERRTHHSHNWSCVWARASATHTLSPQTPGQATKLHRLGITVLEHQGFHSFTLSYLYSLLLNTFYLWERSWKISNVKQICVKCSENCFWVSAG